MMKFLPFLLLLFGIGTGLFFGMVLRPSEDELSEKSPTENVNAELGEELAEPSTGPLEGDREFIKLNNQFIVPVVSDAKVKALVVVSLGLEVATNSTSSVFSAEPKLRDALLQVLFDHANIGGFNAEFTNSRNMAFLREALTAKAQSVLGEAVLAVLITDLARQDT